MANIKSSGKAKLYKAGTVVFFFLTLLFATLYVLEKNNLLPGSKAINYDCGGGETWYNGGCVENSVASWMMSRAKQGVPLSSMRNLNGVPSEETKEAAAAYEAWKDIAEDCLNGDSPGCENTMKNAYNEYLGKRASALGGAGSTEKRKVFKLFLPLFQR